MPQKRFTYSSLRSMMATSPAYNSLPATKKQDIEACIKAKDTPSVKFVYYTLLEEQAELQVARRALAEQMIKISEEQGRKIAGEILRKIKE